MVYVWSVGEAGAQETGKRKQTVSYNSTANNELDRQVDKNLSASMVFKIFLFHFDSIIAQMRRRSLT